MQRHRHEASESYYSFQNTGWGAPEGTGANRWTGKNPSIPNTAYAGEGNGGNLQPYTSVNMLIKI